MMWTRYCHTDPVTGRPGGEYFLIDGTKYDARYLADLEFKRAKIRTPRNPGFSMRPIFSGHPDSLPELRKLIKGVA